MGDPRSISTSEGEGNNNGAEESKRKRTLEVMLLELALNIWVAWGRVLHVGCTLETDIRIIYVTRSVKGR